MRTTLDIDNDLLARAKALAALERTSLTRIIEEALASRLRSGTSADRDQAEIQVPIIHGSGGLNPAIKNPASYRDILDIMDAPSEG